MSAIHKTNIGPTVKISGKKKSGKKKKIEGETKLEYAKRLTQERLDEEGRWPVSKA